jgi:hypothetical protein
VRRFLVGASGAKRLCALGAIWLALLRGLSASPSGAINAHSV